MAGLLKIIRDHFLNYAQRCHRLLLLLLFAGLMAGRAHAQNGSVPIHDPVMIQQDDVYYLFGTGRGITAYASTDMKEWKRLGPVLESVPEWVHEVVPGFRGSFWAPDIVHHNGMYYLYYSVSAFGRNTSAIGVATNTTLHPDDPDFKWVDRGKVVKSVPGRDMWNAIDPNLAFDEEGTPWMAFGSYWMGIKLVKMAENLTGIAGPPEEWHTIASRYRYWKIDERDAGDTENSDIEAPFIFKRNGYYYLFASWDRCCSGENSTYKVVVGRSRAITGPYLDRSEQKMIHGGGTLVARGNEHYAGIGHNAVYTFDGTDYLIAHGYDLSDEGRSKLLILKIEWDAEGWPHASPLPATFNSNS